MADILLLANSYKHGGYCVAGKDINNNKWVRIVGDQEGSALTLAQLKYKNLDGILQNNDFEPFNKFVRIDLGDPVPKKYQPENVLIGQTIWQEVKAEYILNYDSPLDLWGVGNSISSAHIEDGLTVIKQSLYIIQVKEVEFYGREMPTRRQLRAKFRYNDFLYDLPVTMNLPTLIEDGEKRYNSRLTISLGEEYCGYHYKLVAAIF
jgi:hypothetical protein